MDPYATLGVTREAETAVIASAYRALAKLYHPDRYSGDREFATRRLKEINAAYEILSNEEKRKAYDAENTKQYSKGAGYQSSSEGEDEKVLNAIEEEWDYATKFHPELVQLRAELRQIDQSLANAFVAYLVLSKSYSDAPSAFGMFKDEYLLKKFGNQKKVRELAYTAIKSGNRSFALDLNKALMRLGQSSIEEVLKHLATQHPEFAETAYPKYGFRHIIILRKLDHMAEENLQREAEYREKKERRRVEAERKIIERHQRSKAIFESGLFMEKLIEIFRMLVLLGLWLAAILFALLIANVAFTQGKPFFLLISAGVFFVVPIFTKIINWIFIR